MKTLTVQQPYAWAIMYGGKSPENRTQAWRYRGPLAIHAGTRISQRGMQDQQVGHALRDRGYVAPGPSYPGAVDLGAPIHLGVILGLVDLVDVHPDTGCCEPWGEHGRSGTGRRIVHLVLENPRPLPVPFPCRGHQGLWTPPADAAEALAAVA